MHTSSVHTNRSQTKLSFCELIKEIYGEFGFNDMFVKFSDRPEQRVGSDEVWDSAEQALRDM